ncbi:hypothetical protein D9Q98_010336 [Chlorella vulgaris]|uniref:C2H2-type domain-containing protein n=1 Tax=Chlorella vulgaris TaxID=3077 RepID=A0A9D4TK01_CHLVU|nr:hypothetical protein D9Q98_010336 [Chlorella vulgaris]
MDSSAGAGCLAAPGGSPAAAAAGTPPGGMAPDWAFPVFVGCRRRLPPTDSLFEPGNFEREQLARQAAVAVARDERRQLSREAALSGSAELADRLLTSYECGRCHASLPTQRLRELHVVEMHDSYFAAQAARRMPVYLCLVEGCPRKFCTVEERKQHLADHHKFPRHFKFDRLHLRRRKAQIRALPRYQKGHGRQAMQAAGAEEDTLVAAAPGAAAAAAAAAWVGSEEGGSALGAAAGPSTAQHLQQVPAAEKEGGTMPGTAAVQHDDVLHGLSRLSMAAETSSVPSIIHFGRGRGRGLMGGRGRGRAAPGKPPAPASPAAASATPADAAQAAPAACGK